MARLLTLIRHAKAGREQRGERGDFDRSLAPRGERDVVRMGHRLLEAGAVPELFVTSAALRARQTAEAIAAEVGYPRTRIRANEGLYLASEHRLLEAVRETDDAVRHLALVAHNPGISDLWDWLTDSDGPGMPTCGIARLELAVDSWSDAAPGRASLIDFDYPKRDPKRDAESEG